MRESEVPREAGRKEDSELNDFQFFRGCVWREHREKHAEYDVLSFDTSEQRRLLRMFFTFHSARVADVWGAVVLFSCACCVL